MIFHPESTDLEIAYSPAVENLQSTGISEDALFLKGEFTRLHKNEGYLASLPLNALGNPILDAYNEAREANWDGYGALPANLGSLRQAWFFAQMLPSEIPLPEIAIDNDGEISFDWSNGRRKNLSVSISERSDLTYAFLIGPDRGSGTFFFDFKNPNIEILDFILHQVKRIYT